MFTQVIGLTKINFKSGLAVALVSIPLSVSLAVASGATPLVGMITAIWAGLFASIFGGSNFNIVGPTGALSGVIAAFVILNGAASLPMLAILTGVIVVVAYLLKLEKYLILIPSSVIHGFTLGVAFIIGLSQTNFALGLAGLTKHERFLDNILESFKHLAGASLVTFAIFCVFLIALLLFSRFAPKLPGVILLTPLGILLGYLGQVGLLPFDLQTLGGMFGEISFKIFSNVEFGISSSLLSTALVVSLIAILETMLSAKIADIQTNTKHNERKEMLGLGLANLASGLAGGMPATAALARTSLNVKTGATHKTSGIISAIGIILVCLFLFGYFKYIPLAVIAAILVYVAIKMVEQEHYVKLWMYERHGFFVSLLVAVVTVGVDPMVGILLGVSVALLLFVHKMSLGHFDVKSNKFKQGLIDSSSGYKLTSLPNDADVMVYSFRGKLCYINNKAHLKRFHDNFKNYKLVVLRFRETYLVDTDGATALDEIIGILQSRGQEVLVTGVEESILPILTKLSPRFRSLKERGLLFSKSEDALIYAGVLE